MGIDNKVASFTVPNGGTAFIAQAFNIGLTMTDYLMVIMTATLASVGTAGVPGVVLVMLAIVLNCR